MAAFLAPLMTYGPSVYCLTGIPSTTIFPSYIKHVSVAKRLAKDLLPDLFQKMKNLRDDILLIDAAQFNRADLAEKYLYPAALGTNFGHSAVICYSQDLENVDSDAFRLICKHEISHLYWGDGLIISLIAFLGTLVGIVALNALKVYVAWWLAPAVYCLPFIVGINAYVIATQFKEGWADAFAADKATPDELHGICRLLQVQIEVGKVVHATSPRIFTKEGNIASDITHLPLTKRLEFFTKELQDRKIDRQEIPAEKVQQLRAFHIRTYEKMFKIKLAHLFPKAS